MFSVRRQSKTIVHPLTVILWLFIAAVVITDADTLIAQTINWTQVAYSSAPPARADAAIAYDPATQSTVLFGGLNDFVVDLRLSLVQLLHYKRIVLLLRLGPKFAGRILPSFNQLLQFVVEGDPSFGLLEL